MIRLPGRALSGVLVSTLCLPAAMAEVVDFRGSASVRIDEFRDGTQTGVVETSDRFPETDPTLPVQVVGLLLPPLDPNDPDAGEDELAAAAAAAQFDDPTELDQPNPEEFAINLTLNSVSPVIAYRGQASAEEVRTVRFAPDELGPGTPAGTMVPLTGRLFVDGALAMLAVEGGRDLTGASVKLGVQVLQSGGGGTATVFNGSLELRGTANGATEVTATGGFPIESIVLSDLSLLDPDFGIFRVLVIPNIMIDYDYEAIVDEDIVLTATVSVDAMNLPGSTGVAAVIGTPTDTLDQVIGATAGAATGVKIREAVQSERAAPTGTLAFPEARGSGLCTLAGLGMMLTLTAGCVATRRGR